MCGQLAQHGGRDDVIRIDEALLGLVLRGTSLLDFLTQFRGHPDAEVGDEVGDEAGGHDGTVLVDDGRVGHDVGHVAVVGAEQRERRSEEKEVDAVGTVEAYDGGQQRERRVVHHYAVLGVLLQVFIVAAGIERADDLATLHVGQTLGELQHHVIDGGRCVAVVGRELLLELVDELVILFVTFSALG